MPRPLQAGRASLRAAFSRMAGRAIMRRRRPALLQLQAAGVEVARRLAATTGCDTTVAGSGWPETMRRELQACRSAADRRAWSEKWALYLSGQAQGNGPTRPAGYPQPL